MSHPSDNIALNIEVLFVSPVIDDEGKQARIDTVVAAAKAFANTVVIELPEESTDRQKALACIRDSCDRAVSAIIHDPVLVPDELPPPVI